MSDDAPAQLAPGIHRLGNEYVNCYLLEEGNDLTLVDGGLPGFRPQLDTYLQSRGRSVKDITAVILTHAHADHVGIVEHVREDSQAPVHVHAKDAEMARTGKTHKRDGSLLPYLRYPRSTSSSWSRVAPAGPARPTSRWSRRSTPSWISTCPAARGSSPRRGTPPGTSPSTCPSRAS